MNGPPMHPHLPQPGERCRIRIRPVEYECPGCHRPLEIAAFADDGAVVTIVDPAVVYQPDSFVHQQRGCNASIPLPEGWLWYTDGQWYYTLPYTLFEPLEERDDA